MSRRGAKVGTSVRLLAVLGVLAAATAGAPRGLAAGAPQRFYGNMPLIIDPTPVDRLPFHFAAHQIGADSNLLVLHMDWFPVPWREFAAGGAPPEAWSREMDAIRGPAERVGLPVYLALTPIAGSRDRLSAQAGGSYALIQDDSFSAPCEAIDARPGRRATACASSA